MSFLGELYEPNLKEHFKHHPHGDELVEKMLKENCSPEQIDLWFAEAEHCTHEHLMSIPMPVSEDGKTVRFEIHE